MVEDNEWYNKLLVHTLSLNPDYYIESFTSAAELIKELHRSPEVITLDYRLPDMIGSELLREIQRISPTSQVVVISEQSEIETAVDLLKAGAYDYLVKSDDIRDRLLNTISHLRSNLGLKQKIKELTKEVQGKYEFEKAIVGNSKAMKSVFDLIAKALDTNITVSVTGETGTGKEVVAKAIHYNSTRKSGPFVAVNMAAIPKELVESELFGHEKGSFTGAAARRIGKFEEASGGTLFLDEIGDMEPSFQAKLLRVLQEKEVTRVGSNKPVKTDCRIIIATNRNLQEDVQKGLFREDLFYRLLGIPIELPPLRDRGRDVLLLAQHFIKLFCKENQMDVKALSEDARAKLTSYRWPGNIRELKSVVELAAVMSPTDQIEAKDITLRSGDALPDVLSEELTLREYNRRIVQLYMDRYGNNTRSVAEKLGIGQTTVYRLLKEIEEETSN